VEATVQSRTEDDRAPDKTGETVIPLLAEEVAVAKQVVETGRVQVSRVTHRHHEAVVTRLPVEAPAAGEGPDASTKSQQSKQEG